MFRGVDTSPSSVAITKLDEELQKTSLWNNVTLRNSVFQDTLPALLLEKIGLEKIMERVSRLI
jgi:glutamate dehydrogenase